MIPKVKPWKVRYYAGSRIVFETTVSTINKRFAGWLAHDVVWALPTFKRLEIQYADRKTINPAKQEEVK